MDDRRERLMLDENQNVEAFSDSDRQSFSETVRIKQKSKMGKYVVKLKIKKHNQQNGYENCTQKLDISSISSDIAYNRLQKECSLESEDGGIKNAAEEDIEEDKENELVKTPNNHICPVCSKKFISMKSLSGHMRCHPERNWRGIQPPPNAKNSATSESEGGKMDNQIDSGTTTERSASEKHVRSLSSWPPSSKRGRNFGLAVANPKVEVTSYEEQFPEEPLPDAVFDLLMLSRSDPLEFASFNKKSKMQKCEQSDGYMYSESTKMSSKLENSEEEQQQNSEESESNSTSYSRPVKEFSYKLNEKKTMMRKKRKIKALKAVPSSHPADSQYHCMTCNKTFSSHQALGGHRASHKKGKTDPSVVDADQDMTASAAVSEESPEAYKPLPNPSTMMHRCKTCDKTFSSGQALGGHQRRHYVSPVEAPASSITLQGDERKTVHNFDLNMPPPIEDDQFEYESSF